MFQTTLQQLKFRRQKLDQKLSKLNSQKTQSIQTRIKQLTDQLNKQSFNQQYSKNVQEARNSFAEFKAKNKALYKSIFQGARLLDERKKYLVEDIQGAYETGNQGYGG